MSNFTEEFYYEVHDSDLILFLDISFYYVKKISNTAHDGTHKVTTHTHILDNFLTGQFYHLQDGQGWVHKKLTRGLLVRLLNKQYQSTVLCCKGKRRFV